MKTKTEKPDKLTIGRLAQIADVGVETIRYYERRGLIRQPRATAGAFRVYPQDTIGRIHFIRRAKELGFTLSEIAELLSDAPLRDRIKTSPTAADLHQLIASWQSAQPV